jgi:hypothetical protein
MRRIVAAAWLLAACCGRAPRPTTPAPPQTSAACDATGVWRIVLGDADAFEVTVDPTLARVELPEETIGHDSAVAVALDVPRCRLHVIERSTQRYEEGYGDTDTTLHLEISLGPGRRPVTGVTRTVTLDPPGEDSFEIRGTAERRATWTTAAASR